MSSTHQPYNTPNTPVGTPTPQGPHPIPYQHWLDDAAQMGLMLYRMRNDSKRERVLRNQPPVVIRTTTNPPPAGPARATPRTSAALQVPTVATQPNNRTASSGSHATPPSLHLPLD